MSVGKRQSYAHLSLVESLDFILKGRHGDQAIRASTAPGIRKGWDPGPPVWDPAPPIDYMRTQRSNVMIVLEEVEQNRHPKEQSRCLVRTQAPSDKIQVAERGGIGSITPADQLEQPQHRQWKDR
jgi:hypothetical protein